MPLCRAAFVAATRRCREHVVLRTVQRVDFREQVAEGEVVGLVPEVVAVGRSSMTVAVQMWAENLRMGGRRAAGPARWSWWRSTARDGARPWPPDGRDCAPAWAIVFNGPTQSPCYPQPRMLFEC